MINPDDTTLVRPDPPENLPEPEVPLDEGGGERMETENPQEPEEESEEAEGESSEESGEG